MKPRTKREKALYAQGRADGYRDGCHSKSSSDYIAGYNAHKLSMKKSLKECDAKLREIEVARNSFNGIKALARTLHELADAAGVD